MPAIQTFNKHWAETGTIDGIRDDGEILFTDQDGYQGMVHQSKCILVTQHSPGPWEYRKVAVELTELDEVKSEAYCVYETVESFNAHDNAISTPMCVAEIENLPNAEANAKLIAAAPEMLNALKNIYSKACLSNDLYDEDGSVTHHGAFDEIEMLIRKLEEGNIDEQARS